MATLHDQDFPCKLTLHVPFPTEFLAKTVLRAISVDSELSPLVRRKITTPSGTSLPEEGASAKRRQEEEGGDEGAHGEGTLLVEYEATTNRMLRVAVNSFMDSLKLVLEVMEVLDVDVLDGQSREKITG